MADFNAKFTSDANFKATFNSDSNFGAKFGETNVIEIGHYRSLPDKPSIEGHILVDDSTLQQIGVGTASTAEIEKILYLD